MLTTSDYEQWKARQKSAAVGAANVVISATDVKPDQLAGDLNLAAEFGKVTGNPVPPAPMVAEFRSVFQEAIEKRRAETILSSSPRLTEWLRDPDNAALARDDLEGLSWFETGLSSVGNALGRGVRRMPQTYNQFMANQTAGQAQDAQRSFGEILTDQREPITVDGKVVGREWLGPGDALGAVARYALSRLNGDAQGDAQAFQQQAGEIAKNIAQIPMSPAGERFKGEFAKIQPSGDWTKDVGQFVSAAAADPSGLLAFLTETAVESVPGLAVAASAGLLTRDPALAAGVMGLASGAQEYGTAPVEFFNEKGIDVSTPEGALAVVTNPELMREAAERGVVRGTIIGVMDGLSGGLASQTLARSGAFNMVLQSISQAVMGASGEAGAQLAAGQELNMAEVIVEGLAEFVSAPIEVAGMGFSRVRRGQREARDAETRRGLFQQLAGQAGTSKLRARMPEAFRQFVEAATASGPVENLYIPAEQFVSYFQGAGLDPFALVDQMDGVTREDLEVALAGGGDLQIPTATYATKIAGSEHDAFLMENMRFDPDQFTAAEAADFNSRVQEVMQEAWDEAEGVRLEDEKWRAVESQIYDDMVSRLRISGRSTDVATTEAMIYPAFYRVMAERAGMTTEDFLARYPLPRVAGSIPEGMQLRDVDELTRTLAEARNRRAPAADTRRSLLEFVDDYGGIDDPGGELAARDAATVKRGKGKKTLRLLRSSTQGQSSLAGMGSAGKRFGIDDVAQAAIEAGFMADDPVVAEYRAALERGGEIPDITRPFWDAVDAELRGDRQVSEQDADPVDREREAMLDQIEAYLAELGLTLDDEDATIRAAFEAARDDDARQYAQGGGIEAVEDLARSLGVDLSVSERGGYVTVGRIVAGERGQGAGSRVMQALVEYADAAGKTLALTPSKDFGGTVSRLREFYARFGFVDNKGRAKDFGTRETMIRAPRDLGARRLFQNDQGPRGVIQIPGAGVGNGDTVIRLFERANLSTLLHETGHYFLAVMQDMEARGEGQAVGDMASVRAWWRENAAAVAADGRRAMPDVALTPEDVERALDTGTTGDMMKDAAVDVGIQEQWARAFEGYLLEGRAPSLELRGAFEKFRAWLLAIYKRLSGVNVQMSDEIRQVFDRMLASDAEIAKAASEAGDGAALFPSAEAMGLTPEEYAGFLKLRSQAEDDAKARMLREAMEPIRREREAWYRDEKEKVRAEVEREVNGLRQYRAIEWMGNRRWLDDGQPSALPDMRMSKDILVQRYGEGVLKTLPRGKQTVYSVEGGIDPDDAAGWFGFGSGDEMIRAMEQAPRRVEAISAEVERVMYERHGDVLSDGTAEAQALDAVHSDKRGQWIAAELKAIVDVAGAGTGLTAKEARASARSAVAGMKVRDAMNANRFLAAERKAGEEAARLGATLAREGLWMQAARRRVAGKARSVIRGEARPDAVAAQIERANASSANYNETVQRLAEAKRRQLINHALYMEARKVADEVEKAERFVTQLNKKAKRERIAGAGRRENAQVDYLSAIDEIQDRYDFRRLSAKAEVKRGALQAFVQAMTEQGRENELAIPDDVLRDAGRKPYKAVSVEELRGVVDSLKNLEHIALRWNDLIDARSKRQLDEVVTQISEAFDANVPKRPPGRVATRAEALRHAGRQYLDLILNASTVLREIDGFTDRGAAYENLKTPIDEAMNRLSERKQKAANDLDALYAVYSKEDRRRMAVREHIPELGISLSRWEKISVALNTGNAGNYQRLTDPKVRGSFTEAQVGAVLATLDERDADFIQSVWDYVGSFREDIGAREKRATGVAPQWVEASPVVIAGKTLRGGYYPLKYDPRLSSLARDDEANTVAQSLQAGRFGKAQTRNGHLKERAKSSGRDVELDMSVLHRHINQVIYDLELSEPVANSWRILQDGRVRQAFTDSGKRADFDALEIWLKDVAEGQVNAADFVSRTARAVKSNFTAAKLAFNLGTVAMQITGLSQTMVVVGKRDFAVGVQDSFRPAVRAEIAAKSSFMADRQTTFNKDIFDYYNDPKVGPIASRWGQVKQDVIGPLAFWLMTKVQWHLVDVPTWLAGYRQGLRQHGGDEAAAITHADDIVKRAQASGLFSDRSAIERGSISNATRQNSVVRLFTTLGSYMFAKFNVAYERTMIARRQVSEGGASVASAQAALSWAVDMTFLFAVEAVIAAAIRGKLPDEDDEDDGWGQFLAKETAFSVMGTLPFVRDVASTMGGFEGGGAYGAITKEAATPFVEMVQGEVDKGLIKSIINGTGLATGAPSTQLNRALDAAWRQMDGEDVSPLEYLLGRMGK